MGGSTVMAYSQSDELLVASIIIGGICILSILSTAFVFSLLYISDYIEHKERIKKIKLKEKQRQRDMALIRKFKKYEREQYRQRRVKHKVDFLINEVRRKGGTVYGIYRTKTNI